MTQFLMRFVSHGEWVNINTKTKWPAQYLIHFATSDHCIKYFSELSHDVSSKFLYFFPKIVHFMIFNSSNRIN